MLDSFEDFHVTGLKKYPLRHLVLLIDFDDRVEDRTAHFRASFPAGMNERIYLLGTRGEPEPLRKDCGCSLEKIGEHLANACATGEPGLWQHELLQHSHAELTRLVANVKPFLFK